MYQSHGPYGSYIKINTWQRWFIAASLNQRFFSRLGLRIWAWWGTREIAVWMVEQWFVGYFGNETLPTYMGMISKTIWNKDHYIKQPTFHGSTIRLAFFLWLGVFSFLGGDRQGLTPGVPQNQRAKPIAEGSSEEHMGCRQQLVFVSGIES